MSKNQHTLLEVNQFLKRVVAANLPEAIWVTCEIMQIGNSRGHYYIDLIEKDAVTQQIVAQSQAVIWKGTYYRLKKKIGENFNNLLQAGIQVLLQVRVDFSERYGLKLVIEDIDPAYTLGQMELQRQATIDELKKAGLIGKNRQVALSIIPQRIAVISSSKAAGLQDFLQELTDNQYGYQFNYQLFTAAMQGQFAEKEIVEAFRQIQKQKAQFDTVVLIRGGGSKLDLSAFDSLKLCTTIANFPLPVLTGIGHDIDESIADMVGHTALKTPTAVATFLVEQLLHFEMEINQLQLSINNRLQYFLQQHHTSLEQTEQQLKYAVKTQLSNEHRMLEYIEHELPKVLKNHIRTANAGLDLIEKTINLLSPASALKRGFTITTKAGKIIRSKAALSEGDIIETHFEDGKISSII